MKVENKTSKKPHEPIIPYSAMIYFIALIIIMVIAKYYGVTLYPSKFFQLE